MTFVRGYAMPLVGLVLILAGVLIVLAQPPVGFGWTAYAPREGGIEATPMPFVMSAGSLVGALLVEAGILVLVAWAGYRLGRRGAAGPPTR